MLEGFPDAEIAVDFVWIGMLAGDDAAAAREAAAVVSDRRARHFYDPDLLVGKTIARQLGHDGEVAWDIYLFYPPTCRWEAMPPAPLAWAHQMSATWPPADHRHLGHDLFEELRHVTQSIHGRFTA